jgi:hypothetical protein
MYPFDLIKLQPLMDISIGSPNISIGVVDGPIDRRHPVFNNARLKSLKLSSQI